MGKYLKIHDEIMKYLSTIDTNELLYNLRKLRTKKEKKKLLTEEEFIKRKSKCDSISRLKDVFNKHNIESYNDYHEYILETTGIQIYIHDNLMIVASEEELKKELSTREHIVRAKERKEKRKSQNKKRSNRKYNNRKR